jgi:hypothetical protein
MARTRSARQHDSPVSMQDLRAGYALHLAICGDRGATPCLRYAVVRVLDCLCNPATHLTYALAYVGRGLWSNGKSRQRLIIEPAPPKSLLAVLATLPTPEEEFPPIEDLPAEPVDL